MDLRLERANILQTDFISKKGTMKLLPVGKKGKQKLVVGDDSGNVTCYEFKKGEPQVVFQVKAFEGPISSISIGGLNQKLDRIFASNGQTILGLTKKGKEFFKLQTPLTEEINAIHVYDTKIFTGCEYIYNLYDDGNETAYFISKDVINDLAIECITSEDEHDVLLGCQDNTIRVLRGSNCICEVPTSSPITCLTSVATFDASANKRGPVYVIYGMDSGAIGEVRLEVSGGSVTATHVWVVDDHAEKHDTVSCIKAFDLTKCGCPAIIVGRDDGRVEVYTRDTMGLRPKLSFSHDVEESVRGLECGLVNSTEFNEILVAGYSGKILSFTTEPVLQRAHDDNYGRSVQTINNENRIRYLQKEIELLKAKVAEKQDKVKKISASSLMKPPPDFSVNSKFALDPSHAAYTLSLELQSPIDIVIVRSPVILDFIDTGATLISVTPPELMTDAASSEDGAYKFVAAFRCQTADVRRIAVSIRSTEGEFGDVLVTVVTALTSTVKAAKVLRYTLKPLSLHSKVHVLTDEQLARPRNSIKFTGQMAINTIHEWVQQLLPDVPPRLAQDSVQERFFFRHTFTDSITICEFRKNELIFESESASSIVIAKENVVRFANSRRIQIDSSLQSNSSSVRSFLSLIRPKLEYQISLSRKAGLVDAIQEIAMQTDVTTSGDAATGQAPWLCPEYAEILRGQEDIRQEFKLRTKSLDYLTGIITDLFVDWNRLHNKDGKPRIPALRQALLDNKFDQLVGLFVMSNERQSRKYSA